MTLKKSSQRQFYKMKTKDKILRVSLVVITYLACMAVLLFSIKPQSFIIAIGDVATETIKATFDVEDGITTLQMRNDAADGVADIYRLNTSTTDDVLLNAQTYFNEIENVRVLASHELSRLIDEANTIEILPEVSADPDAVEPVITPNPTIQIQVIPELSFNFVESLSTKLPISLSENDIRSLANKSSTEITSIKDLVLEKLSQSLNSGITMEYLEQQISNINQDIINPIHGMDESAQRIAMTVVSQTLKANFIYDETATINARNAAQVRVEPVIYKKGQNITIEGETVTPEQYGMLGSLDMLKEDSQQVYKYISLSILMLALFLISSRYVTRYRPSDFIKFRRLASLCLITLLATILAYASTVFNNYFVLMSICALLVAVLLDKREALFMIVIFSLFQAIVMYTGDSGSFTDVVPILTINIVGGIIGVNLIANRPQRGKIIFSGAIIGTVNVVLVICFGILQYIDWSKILDMSIAAFAGGLMASIICLGLLPIWEIVFKILTPMRLLELTNPEQPLLKKMLVEAPGTYHHSIIVGNMAEAAAEAVGANPLIARAGSCYHDIGKLKRPYFFKENQLGLENPHDKLDPILSTRIILSHTTDGFSLELGLPWNAPPPPQNPLSL